MNDIPINSKICENNLPLFYLFVLFGISGDWMVLATLKDSVFSFTDLNISILKKHSYRHIQKEFIIGYLGIFPSRQVNLKLTFRIIFIKECCL
jgi:hypothetical protein